METVNILQALILGLIQGLTELLPISSSAHLAIIPWIFNWEMPEYFDVALHTGTLFAIGLFFFRDWLNLIKGGYKLAIKGEKSQEGKMFWYIVLATIPGAIIGFILDKFLEDALNAPLVIATMLIIMGIVLYMVDKKSKSIIDYKNMSLRQTFLIGLSQALAFIPGVSRSGITMTTARMMGIKRESAAKYSFMLSAPIVLAATILKLKDFVFNIPFFIGIFTSFIVGMIVIKFLLKYLQKGSFKIFAVYRIIFGLFIVIIFFIK